MKKILIISPHPDDETLGAGGTLIKFKKKKLFWLNITDMKEEFGYSNEQINRRKIEVKKISKIYNFKKSIHLGLPANQLDQIPMDQIIKKIKLVFDSLKPDTVFIPNPGDVHSDHNVIAKASLACCKTFRNKNIKKIFLYETLSETNFNFLERKSFKPNYYFNITKSLNLKIKSLKIYKSEFKKHPFPRSVNAVRSLAILRGSESGYKYAEGFKLIFEKDE